MAYGTPADPVGGTVITVSYAVTNLLDPIRWLRQLTGNADPPGSNYVVRSTSTTGTTWSKVTTDTIDDLAVTTPKLGAGAVTAAKMGTGAAVGNIGYTPVNRAGDSMTGTLQVRQTLIMESSGGVPGRVQLYDTDGTTFWLVTPDPGTGNLALVRSGTGAGLVLNDHAGANSNQLLWLGSRVWTAADAPTFAGALAAASAAIVGAISAASAAIAGNATVGGTLGVTGAQTNSSTIQATRFISTQTSGTPPFQVTSTDVVTNLHADDSDKLGTVAAASYARKDAASNFTTVPTIASRSVVARHSGTYSGNGPGGANEDFEVITTFDPKFTVIRGSDSTIFFLIGTQAAIRVASGAVSTSADTNNGTGVFLVDYQNSGPNASGVTYHWESFG